MMDMLIIRVFDTQNKELGEFSMSLDLFSS